MAVIAISRQVAALGDEVSEALAKKLGYTFTGRKAIEKRIVELGFPAEKMEKYDERRPGFFASLAKDRDAYLNYMRTAILEAASQGNCVLIGRGTFVVLENVPNLISVRFVSDDAVRIRRLMDEFNWTEKQALQRINESDTNRMGFHQNFFNIENENPAHYQLTVNTARVSLENTVSLIEDFVRNSISENKEVAGNQKIAGMYRAQLLVNELFFNQKLNINFLHAAVEGDELILQGVTDSAANVEKALTISSSIISDKKVRSDISIVQNFKPYV